MLRASLLAPFGGAVLGFAAGCLFLQGKATLASGGRADSAQKPLPAPAGEISANPDDRRAALLAAFAERDPLRRDAAIFRVIERMDSRDLWRAFDDLPALAATRKDIPRAVWAGLAEALTERWLEVDPAAAAAWVERIGDVAARQNAAADVFNAWSWEDPVASRVWLRGLEGLDESWKEKTEKDGR